MLLARADAEASPAKDDGPVSFGPKDAIVFATSDSGAPALTILGYFPSAKRSSESSPADYWLTRVCKGPAPAERRNAPIRQQKRREGKFSMLVNAHPV